MPCRHAQGLVPSVVEADISEGVRAVPLSAFGRFHCRICRPVGLKASDVNAVCHCAIGRVGEIYDLKNVLNLARSLIPAPPVPQRWRRKLLALDSGDPTRALCSTLIAQAFQSLQHPILPSIKTMSRDHPYCHDGVEQVLHVRHHCLFAPRDFDVSPYFEIIKPTLSKGFDHRALNGATASDAGV